MGDYRTETTSKIDYFVFETCIPVSYMSLTDDLSIELHDDALVVHEIFDKVDIKMDDVVNKTGNNLNFVEFKLKTGGVLAILTMTNENLARYAKIQVSADLESVESSVDLFYQAFVVNSDEMITKLNPIKIHQSEVYKTAPAQSSDRGSKYKKAFVTWEPFNVPWKRLGKSFEVFIELQRIENWKSSLCRNCTVLGSSFFSKFLLI